MLNLDPHGMSWIQTTPARITSVHRRFCKELTGSNPFYLPVEPTPDALPRECFANVEAKVQRDGGGVQYGWIIWEMPEIALEAEFHAVWRGTENRFIDITPQVDGEERVLFVPDHKHSFSGRNIPNRVASLSVDPMLRQVIAMRDADAVDSTHWN